ncbi:hypothetical protein AB0M02_24495 [Actinoplanes sp. NPDC051861]|uniref:hypothetical protein n=1 Tax=Actinoplanes sp. NPDC051861 TaxID=3155170 RepID=UPI0034412FD9
MAAVLASMVMAVGGAVAVAGPAQADTVLRVEIVNDGTNRCMVSTGIANYIRQGSCGTTAARWNMTVRDDGSIIFSKQSEGLCVHAVWGSLDVLLLACNATDGRQVWTWEGGAPGSQVLANETPWGPSCLRLSPYSVGDVRIRLADCANSLSEYFHARPV